MHPDTSYCSQEICIHIKHCKPCDWFLLPPPDENLSNFFDCSLHASEVNDSIPLLSDDCYEDKTVVKDEEIGEAFKLSFFHPHEMIKIFIFHCPMNISATGKSMDTSVKDKSLNKPSPANNQYLNSSSDPINWTQTASKRYKNQVKPELPK